MYEITLFAELILLGTLIVKKNPKACGEEDPNKKPITPPKPPTPMPKATSAPAPAPAGSANSVDGWTLMLREMIKSPIGADLFGLIPGDTAFGWSAFVGQGSMSNFYGHLITGPHGFDPANSLDPANVGSLAHELTHVLQRTQNRPGMCDNCTTLYNETEAYIIGWAVKYDLTTDVGARAQIKGSIQFATGPLQPMFDWLKKTSTVYASASEGIVGNGNWRDTLPGLGYSQAVIQHVEDIIR